MTLDHTQWASLHAVNDVKRLIVWLPNSGHPGKDGGNCLWSLVSWVACTSTVFYVALPVFSKHCWVVHVSTVSSCALTSVTHFHCTATMAHLWLQILLLEATTVCSNQLHATPTVIFFLKSVSTELRCPSSLDQSSWELKLWNQEKISQKLTSLLKIPVV